MNACMKNLLTVFLMLLSLNVMAVERHALVIGLGRYKDPAWSRINGDKDVAMVHGMLFANGYDDIRELVNEEATKSAIVGQLVSLGRRCGKGDIVYIHFAGHGQRVTDLDGDEPDGWDESWIPYDACRRYSASYHGENHLVDDELYVYLSAIRDAVGAEGTVAVVVDACHSGDSTRGAPDGEEECVRGVYDTFNLPGKRSPIRASRPEERWVTLSACLPYQLNQEFCGMGKLTYLLVNYWSLLKMSDNTLLIKQIDERMQSRQLTGRYPQNPALSGDGTRFSSIFR